MNPAWTVRASLARDRSAGVRTRAHGLQLGQSVDFGAASSGPSAVETLLGALGSDILLLFSDLCERRRLPIDQAEARVNGRLGNALVVLGVVGEEGDPGLEEVSVTLSVASPATEQQLRTVWDDVVARSPLVATLRKSADLQLELQLL